jgi:hypothetical protein
MGRQGAPRPEERLLVRAENNYSPSEPRKTEPGKAESQKTQHRTTEPRKTEPRKADSQKTQHRTTESRKTEPE